jgi:hypothetical protein
VIHLIEISSLRYRKPLLSPLQGSIVFTIHPWLTPWAAFLRRVAATRGALCHCFRSSIQQSSGFCLVLHFAQNLVLGKKIQAVLERRQAVGDFSV